MFSAAHVTGVATPAGLALVNSLPVEIPLGGAANLGIRYTPTTPGAPSGSVVVTTDGVGGPIAIPTTATTGGQEVTDFGPQPFDGAGLTSLLSIVVPSDAISVTVEATCGATTVIGLGTLTGPNGEVFENQAGTGMYFQWPDNAVFDAQVPNTDRPAQRLIPGTWTTRIRRFSGGGSTTTVRAIVERRPAQTGGVGTLDLNVFLAKAIGPKAATAANDTNMSDVLSRMDGIFAQQGIRIGKVDFYDVSDATYDDVTQAEFGPMLALSGNASKTRLNFFFVRTAFGGGVIGVSAKIGGPSINGTTASGVMGIWIENPSASNRGLVALVACHEIGHYLGLLHTVESDGTTHDIIDDTAECGVSGCALPSQQYLMHWQATGGSVLTNGEGLVIRGHPLMEAAVPAGQSSVSAARILVHQTIPYGVEPNWCGTCAACGKAR